MFLKFYIYSYLLTKKSRSFHGKVLYKTTIQNYFYSDENITVIKSDIYSSNFKLGN